jgi:hypothetical protein
VWQSGTVRMRVSPDERRVLDVIRRAERRARLLLTAESVSWSATIAAFVVAIGMGLRWPLVADAVAAVSAAAAIGCLVFTRRRRSASRRDVVRALERQQPRSRNLLVTADELWRGELTAALVVRARVLADASEVADAVDLRAAFPYAPVYRALGTLVAAVLIAVAASRARDRSAPFPVAASGAASTSSRAESAVHISVTTQPPAYTGLTARTLTDPLQIEAIEGSTVTISTVGAASRVLASRRLTETGYVTVEIAESDRRIIPVVVTPDAFPVSTIAVPGRDLIYGGGNPRVSFDVRATDDFGLRSLTLAFTKVSGSGEQFDFPEGQIPLSIVRENGRAWRGAASRTLAELDLKEGDMLVYRAVAADARPGDGRSSSETYFIEVSARGLTAADAFTLPEQETRYALSQQMLILKTERLAAKRASLAPNEVTEALNLAVEQRMIRVEFVFMLGGEVEDEAVEAERSTELQEGRLQNRGQRDLRDATIAMSRAEQLLTAADLTAALVAERAAVAALQRAFARGRYILRALGQRANLDFARRLTGDISNAASWRRIPVDAQANRRAALLQSLLEGLAALKSDDADFRPRARVLSEQAIRIDPASADMRKAAAELQRASGTQDAASRSAPVAEAVAAATAEARRSHAPAPPALTPTDGSLTGAFADAIRHR